MSTDSFNFFIPSSARVILLRPSNVKGFVTTATVNIPCSLAISAIIGAEPVPVPPPIPAVIKSMSASFIAFAITSRSSIAACSPIPGSPPEPKPLVIFVPIGNFKGAFE